MEAEQLTLGLPYRPALGREDFLIANSNRAAIEFIDSWPDWHEPVAIIYGPKSCGKTHILNVWRSKTGAVELTREDLTPDRLETTLDQVPGNFTLDNLEDLISAGSAEQHAVFHLINEIRNKGGTLLCTTRTAPAEWSVALKDLESRMKAAHILSIDMPDDDLLFAIFVKLFHDRQISVDPEMIQFLLSRCDRSFDTVFSMVEKIDAASLQEKRRITLPFIKKVLSL
jgi:DnaA regulatory inactivator Hda